jgi:uncharacterized protein GlcG (DUF336 family)
MRKELFIAAIGLTFSCAVSYAVSAEDDEKCGIAPQTIQTIQSQLAVVAQLNNGGIFFPSRMWSAIVDRQGRLCSVIKIGDAAPASRAIAIAKANTGNGFSSSGIALSTANLYSSSQPGGFLYGVNSSNPFNPAFLAQGTGIGKVPGGIITAGGGVALYSADKEVIGGLGVSGDGACADHVVAYRMRRNAGLDHIPGGAGFNGTDNIDYFAPNEPPNGFKHPHCFAQDLAPGDI